MIDFDSYYLESIRRGALRRGVWWKVLDVTERAIIYLVPRCIDKPRSSSLIRIVAKIIVKLKDAMRSTVDKMTEKLGWPRAAKLSRIAQKWGHNSAQSWVSDREFARYLAIVDMNNISRLRIGETLP